MKFVAAAILAIGAAALHIKEDGTEAPAHYGGYGGYYGDFPFEEPECGDGPTEEEMEAATDEEIWAHIDQNDNGSIDAQEGFNALYCMVEWGYMEEDEAIFMFEFLGEHANLDENGVPDELDPSEAQQAFETLDRLEEVNGERAEDGLKEFPGPPPDCGEKPEGIEEATPEEIFGKIDQDGSGAVDAKEGFEALYCLVEWGMMSEDEAFAAFEHIGSFAGDDDVVDFEEMTAAVEAIEAMSEEEIAAAVDGASAAY